MGGTVISKPRIDPPSLSIGESGAVARKSYGGQVANRHK
jgi:hypothetical protein